MIKASTAFAFAALVSLTAPAAAQTTSAAPAASGKASASTPTGPGSTMTKSSARGQRTAKSLDCSKQADAKKIHGKERRRFMSSCKKS